MIEQTASHVREEWVRADRDIRLFVRSWHPDWKTRAVVAIVPGFNAHSGYYAWAASQFTANGVAAYAVDLRGRGQSDGERFYVRSLEEYVSDVATLVTLVRSREPGLPVYLLGHGAGGVVGCLYVLEYPDQVAGFVCESFMFQIATPEFALAVFQGLSHVAPHAHVLRLKNELFSRDPTVVKAMNADPLIRNETQPTGTLAEMVRADVRLATEFSRIRLPLLILHGTADGVANARGSYRFFEHAGSTDRTLTLYDGHYHDLLKDRGKEIVMADILAWINARER